MRKTKKTIKIFFKYLFIPVYMQLSGYKNISMQMISHVSSDVLHNFKGLVDDTHGLQKTHCKT